MGALRLRVLCAAIGAVAWVAGAGGAVGAQEPPPEPEPTPAEPACSITVTTNPAGTNAATVSLNGKNMNVSVSIKVNTPAPSATSKSCTANHSLQFHVAVSRGGTFIGFGGSGTQTGTPLPVAPSFRGVDAEITAHRTDSFQPGKFKAGDTVVVTVTATCIHDASCKDSTGKHNCGCDTQVLLRIPLTAAGPKG